MKKLFTTTILTILTSGAVHALPVGNPSDASLLCDGLIWEGHCGDLCDPCLTWLDTFSVRFGFYGDYVFNRHLEVDRGNGADIEHTRMNTNAALIVANFWDKVDIFTTLGTTNFLIDTNYRSLGTISGPRIEIETSDHFSWSLGARGTIWECGCTILGAEAQYFSTSQGVRRITVGSLASSYPSNIDAKYHEWQVGVGIAHRINIFVPYIALKWSRARLNFDHATVDFTDSGPIPLGSANLHTLKNKKSIGYAVGISLVDCEKASLTIEGRFPHERAVHVNGQIRF